jgi:hypothetical protein
MANEQVYFKENMKRSIRRHHYQRLKKKQKYRHYWQYILSGLGNNISPKKYFAIRANTPVRCSCVCCGNPRRHFGEVTLQEKKQHFQNLF